MKTLTLTDKDASNLFSLLKKVIGNSTTITNMLDTRTIDPTYEEVMAAIVAVCKLSKNKRI